MFTLRRQSRRDLGCSTASTRPRLAHRLGRCAEGLFWFTCGTVRATFLDLSRGSLAMGTDEYFFDIGRARHDLQYDPPYSPDQALAHIQAAYASLRGAP